MGVIRELDKSRENLLKSLLCLFLLRDTYTHNYTLSLHDALPISPGGMWVRMRPSYVFSDIIVNIWSLLQKSIRLDWPRAGRQALALKRASNDVMIILHECKRSPQPISVRIASSRTGRRSDWVCQR